MKFREAPLNAVPACFLSYIFLSCVLDYCGLSCALNYLAAASSLAAAAGGVQPCPFFYPLLKGRFPYAPM